MSKRYLTIDGHKIACITAGNPALPPVVMIHGWMSHAGVWQQTIDMLCATHYCIAIDHLGFGESDKPDNADYSVPGHAKRVLLVTDALGLDSFTLMGHSLGGQIAMYIASVLAPERVTKLVSVAGVVTGRLGWYTERIIFPRMKMALPFPWLWSLTRWLVLHSERMAKFEFRTWFHDVNRLPFDSWDTDRRFAIHADMRFSINRTGDGIRDMNLTPHLSKLKAPVLIIFGKQDAVVPVEQGIAAQPQIPDCKLKLIDTCGHFPMYEQTREYLEAVKAFV